MKKFISLFLVICMLGGMTVLFSSCKSKIDRGTEAAQLLLANERLDENITSQKLDLGIGATTARTISNNTRVVKSVSRAPLARGITPMSLSSRNANAYTWSGFAENYSSSMREFSQFIESIEFEAVNVSEDIAKMKQKVGVVDKWVQTISGGKQMLRVFESADVLLTTNDESLHVYYRYTDESAKNVYEMFAFMSYDDGTTGDIRTLFIPGERYEYAYTNSGGFEDLFIAENSRGYWIATRFSYNEDADEASFSSYAIKDGLGFGCFTIVPGESSSLPVNNNKSYKIFDPSNNRDLFDIHESEGYYSFMLHTSAIESGLNSITANVTHFDEEDGIRFSNDFISINTSLGDFSATERGKNGEFSLSSMGDIHYDYGDEVYTAQLNFSLHSPDISITESCYELDSYLKSIGIYTNCDMDVVADSVELASLLSEDFNDVFEWNGYTLNSVENVLSARDVLYESYKSARADYEAVKDYDTVWSRQKLSKNAHFADFELVLNGESSFNGTEISISSISAIANDTALFEAGTGYVLKIGLSLLDENGNPSSVNTVALSGGNALPVSYEGGAIMLTQSGTFAVPKNLDSGEYAVVAYITTSEDGIRLSEMKKVAIASIYEGEIESSAMYMDAYGVDGSLVIRYEIKNSRQISLEATKESYSYSEIKRVIMLEILTYGAPYTGAVVESEGGEALSEDSPIGIGTYRMMCYLPTSDGLAQSYVYLTVE